MLNSNYNNRDWDSIKQEYYVLQESTGYLFGGFSAEELNRMGNLNEFNITTRTIGFLIAAHRIHHMKILVERYLNGNK